MLILCIGRRELGKTTLAVSIARHYDTRIIFDPRHMINTTSDVLNEGGISGVLYSMLDTRSEIIVQPHFDKQAAFSAMCSEIYDWLQDNPGERVCILVDEIRFVLLDDPFFDFLIRCTPRKDVAIILTAHGIVDVPTDLRRIADIWCIFQITLSNDLEKIEEKAGAEVAADVASLQPYEFVVWDDSVGRSRKNLDKASWFVPLDTLQHGVNTQ
jgi:hypothetical protein